MIGAYRHRVTLEQPGDPVPDGEGGYTETFAPLDPPTWDCSIQAATLRDLERQIAGTIQASATHLVRGRYHPGITTETRILFEGRQLAVQSVQNVEERDLETVLVCGEIKTDGSAQRIETRGLRRIESGAADLA
jgi:SPP1 family predicted phage head-tail adaptor